MSTYLGKRLEAGPYTIELELRPAEIAAIAFSVFGGYYGLQGYNGYIGLA